MSEIVDFFRKRNLPLSRDTYLAVCYPQGLPEWTAELEDELPEQFQWYNLPEGPAPSELAGLSVAAWAQLFAEKDRALIDNAIRSGVLGGLENVEVARKVIGSLQLNGLDGTTEIIRQQITKLAHAAIVPRKKRTK